MKGWKSWVVVAALALGGLPGTAQADSEVDILLDKLVEKGVLSNVDAGLIRREISETKEVRNKQLAKDIVPNPARNWKWGGDVRLRDEIRNRQTTGADTHRQRIRFRYGVEAKVSDDLKAKFRIATGTAGDPVSTNQSFDTNFTKKNIFLDLANVEYSPTVPGVSKAALIGGIMENPLWVVSPMVWDGDLSLDGAAFKLAQEMGPVSVFTNSGLFILDTDETETSALWVAQGGASFMPFADAEEGVLKNLKLTGAVAYHDYENTYTSATNKSGTDPITTQGDNTTCCEFNQFNPSLELASMVGEVPFAFFTDFVRNMSADSDNRGYAVGMKVGKVKNPIFTFGGGLNLVNGWEAGYMFERLERNAAYDEFTDSDFGGGGNNRRGNVIWLTVGTLKNSTLGAKMFFRQDRLANEGAGATLAQDFREDRIQLDWVTKF